LTLSLILLGLGAAGQWWDGTLERIAVEKSEPPVALLLVVPTLSVAYIAREGEHDIRAHLLQYLRYMDGGAGFLTIAAALICGADRRIMVGI
jgi:hypothetical protein